MRHTLLALSAAVASVAFAVPVMAQIGGSTSSLSTGGTLTSAAPYDQGMTTSTNSLFQGTTGSTGMYDSSYGTVSSTDNTLGTYASSAMTTNGAVFSVSNSVSSAAMSTGGATTNAGTSGMSSSARRIPGALPNTGGGAAAIYHLQ